jgi:hypothetical protein
LAGTATFHFTLHYILNQSFFWQILRNFLSNFFFQTFEMICATQVRNTRTFNRTGQLTGYKLMPGSNCLPLAGPDAKFLRRAAFLNHNLWVTQYNRDECFPGGEFPNQNPRVGEGLPTWVQQDRKLEETDIVLWYSFLDPLSSFHFATLMLQLILRFSSNVMSISLVM